MKPITNLSADQTAALFAAKLRAREQFFFIRYGDGAIECIHERGRGRTCDGEKYSGQLGDALLDSWDRVLDNGAGVHVGDWLSASFDGDYSSAYEIEYRELLSDRHPVMVHFEGLLLMRESAALVDFYRAVREDPRPKLFMGPRANAGAAGLLGADFLEVPMVDLFARVGDITHELRRHPFEILLWGAGMAGTIPAERIFAEHPDRTFINLGSALDPLFRGKSRSQQISPARARALFGELL